MTLAPYKRKRILDESPEPSGGRSRGTRLRFVVQMHAASHLHYDFRLELNGLLISWAVPKGPSMDPSVKRLAMRVEDHPYDYKDFEGRIPKGHYGAGLVIIWDEGYFEPLPTKKGKSSQEKSVEKQLKAGNLKFTLKGKKLKGSFALVKVPSMGEQAWLLLKHDDADATTQPITGDDRSVRSGRTLSELEQAEKNDTRTAATKSSDRHAAQSKATRPTGKDRPQKPTKKIPVKGVRSKMPQTLSPMLATLCAEPFDREGWLFEIKWDGYRTLAYCKKQQVALFSRRQQPLDQQFPSVGKALRACNINAILDGEVVAIDQQGRPDFQLLQQHLKQQKTARIRYYVFDLLWYEKHDLRSLPLHYRKALLESIIPNGVSEVQFCDHVAEEGRRFFDAAAQMELEGIVAKDENSTYTTGKRRTTWLKIKTRRQIDAIICGFTEGRGSRTHFGALILGQYKKDKLVYIGHVGTGFSEDQRAALKKKLKRFIRKRCPFETPPPTNMPATWVKPEFVCAVKFAGITHHGLLRQPVYLGLREDKRAASEVNVTITPPPHGASVDPKTKTQTSHASPQKVARSDLFSQNKEITISVDKKELKLTNLDKPYWPKEGISKGDLIAYYDRMAPVILPWLQDRPQSLHRFPDGINASGFYQKDVTDKVSRWLQTFPYDSDTADSTIQYLVCKDRASLLYMANLGCIAMHPWHSRTSHPDHPDYCLLDLDPHVDNSFDEVIAIAGTIRQITKELHIKSYVKTSGSSGLHVLLPLGAQYTYDQSKMLAELLFRLVHQQHPDNTSMERSPAKRVGKIYLDYLQNRKTQTMAAPYSVRPLPGAPVSAPLHWYEVKNGLRLSDFNIHTMPARALQQDDPFRGLLGEGIQLRSVLQHLQKMI